MNRVSVLIVPLLAIMSQPAAAQSNRFQASAGVARTAPGEFDGTDIGVSVRVSWYPSTLVGADAEVTFYPEEFESFSSSRVEGLFGVTIGPRLGRLRPFVKLRPGFLSFREASEPLACIDLVPAPLPCKLAVGETVFALDLGGGVEFFPTGGTLRVDIGDRLVRRPGNVLDRDAVAREAAFFGHNFRFGVSLGLRF